MATAQRQQGACVWLNAPEVKEKKIIQWLLGAGPAIS
jgi:hypothetical protein